MNMPIVPTSARWMNDAEWEIVTRVFTPAELPFRAQIVVTNGQGAGNSPNTGNMSIPTSLLGTILGGGSLAAIGGVAGGALAGPKGAAIIGFLGAVSGAVQGYLSSLGPQGYILLIGPRRFAGMEKDRTSRKVLVHESTHVWQAKNSWFAMSYVVDSIVTQLAGIVAGTGPTGNYGYTAGAPWSSYNAEQKADIVRDWFDSGEPTTGLLWPYIRDYVRKGIA
jgi:hypothetical protein